MLFAKLISFYFLLLSFHGFAAFEPQAEQQTRRIIPHFKLPYGTLPGVLQATNGLQRIPLPKTAQILGTCDPTPYRYVPKKNSEVIFFKAPNCPDSDFSFVVKGTLHGENDRLNRIASHLQKIGYPSSPSLPRFVWPNFTIELDGKHLSVYPAAKGIRLHDLLLEPPPASDEITQYENDIPLFRNLGRKIFNAHEHLRPTGEELALAIMLGQINIYSFYTDIEEKKLNDSCVKLVPYDAKKMRYFFSRCFGDMQPCNLFLDGDRVDVIDFLTLARDLPYANGFSSVANDVAYFIACTRVYFRQWYSKRSSSYLNTVMGVFVAGYLEKVPHEYRTDMLNLIRDGFRWFVDEVMMPSLRPSLNRPLNDQEENYEALRERYKKQDIEIILKDAARLLSYQDANAAPAA